jgi:predicted glycosyltransferase
MLAKPFTDVIVVPECYKRKLPAEKKVTFKGVFELAYLHPEYFTPDPEVLKLLQVEKGEKYVLVRFVSHNALHDRGHKGMSFETKRKVVRTLQKFAKVFVSSEVELPRELETFRLKVPPEKLHDVLFYASLVFGESATIASESAVLGTPAIFIDDKGRGYTDELERKYGLVFNFPDHLEGRQNALIKSIKLLTAQKNEKFWQEKRAGLLADYIDVTAFMTGFIKNYPHLPAFGAAK